MKSTYSIKNLLLFPFLVSIPSCASSNRYSRKPSMESLEQKIEIIRQKSHMPGLQVTLAEDDKELLNYTSGKRAVGHFAAVTSNDKWHIGSCTKPMTAVLIGMLVDQGKISWDTKLKNILPKSLRLHSSVSEITVKQLLSHTSGLADVTEPEGGKLWPTLFSEGKSSKEMRSKLISGILSLPVRFTPGSKSEYSNSGYVILGGIAEQIWKMDWESIMQQEIFNKLKMNTCGFGSAGKESKSTPSQPWGHKFENGKLISVAPGIQSDNPPAMGPAGTAHCAANDWRKFSSLFLNEQSIRLVSKETKNMLMSKPDIEGPFTLSSMVRLEKKWANGTLLTMAGSNTFNYALVAIAPNLNRIYTINTNSGHQMAEAGIAQVLKEINEIHE